MTESKCPISGASSTSESKCPFTGPTKVMSYPNAAKANDKGIITGLTNKRSSDGMGLPDAISPSNIDLIVATAPVVAPRMLDITKCFYTNVLGKHPELLQFFNPAHNVPVSDHQPKALAASVVAYATNITDLSPLLVPGGAVEAICNRHVALSLYPMQYVVVHENLMNAIGEILGDIVTPEIAGAWSEAVLFLAKVFIDKEEAIYKKIEEREGGWSGFAEFEVSKIKDMTADGLVKQVSFKPPAGSPLEGKNFDFTAGQYISLQIDIDGDGRTAPRHYTCTSPVGADYLQCTIKKNRGGKMSTYVHEYLEVGHKVTLATPVGVFTAPETPTPAVLMSAGIGVTPMVNLQRNLGENVKLVVNVCRSEENHAYKEFFEEAGSDTLFKYTSLTGRPTANELAQETIDKAGTDNEFYVCGPEFWMSDIQDALVSKGAKKVICEVFGSQLATGCPFFTSS
mmetsp:Transcript_14049/g.29676  ORF Transcript_14049/g.29676 Transcript_14049/m.29676 type:complete len:455 (+) Transcript_14049:197-1561(+)